MVFPLPLDFFAPLHLTQQESNAFLQWGNALLQQTIDAYHREQFDTNETRERKWKPIKKKQHLTVYRRRKIKDTTNEYKYLCTGRIDGTLDEVVMGRYADTTPEFRRISGIYREDIVDCAVLGVIQARSPDDPFFLSCFKWMTVESPGKGLVKNRDVCWYEQIGITRDRNGKEIGYTLTESVDLPTCPLFTECVRAKLSICYLYKRNKSGGVNVYMRGKNDAGGKVIDWVADIKSAELWLRIERAMPVAHAVIATALLEAGKNMERLFVTTGTTCEVCHARTSSFLSSAKQCAVCHCFTCSSCVTKTRVLSYHDFRVPQYELFCKKCVRLIHQMDLRAPENVKNPVEYAAASLAGRDGLKMSFPNSRAESCYTDDSEEVEEERAQYEASITSSSSSNGSFYSLRQPVIRMKNYEDEASYFVYAQGSCPVPEYPNHPTRNIRVKSAPSSMPVAYSDESQMLQNTSRAEKGRRRHSHLPCDSTYDQPYAERDSETPLGSFQSDSR
ncbi:unnamed protein product [Peronospora belbahrii]|uniref:FYVE-type domain-containing protein n=1 Tax=Peronospora belbahrii TaxID=622444 RepID=A0AAU9KK84_9STRA|nr:unnamed protein product [Peronospora belbahrii]CAH0514857.1 unnamed protein product [Peronospora belbahrii]